MSMLKKVSLKLKLVLFFLLACVFLEVIQFLMYININFNERSSTNPLLSDVSFILKTFSGHKIPLYIIDKVLLLHMNNSKDYTLYLEGQINSPILLGIDAKYINDISLQQVYQFLELHDFKVIEFNNYKLPMYSSISKLNNPKANIIGVIMKRFGLFNAIVLHTREDNTWWFGSQLDDPNIFEKLYSVGVPKNKISITHDGILDKFEIRHTYITNIKTAGLIPKNIPKFLVDFSESNFIDCNVSKAQQFRETFPSDKSIFALRFKHRAWKLLAKTKTILDKLSLKFWLSSGTCLGYLRECDIIPHSVDVDIGMFAIHFTPNIIIEMEKHGLKLKHWFGVPEDSLEISFVDRTGLKLDIFFFYEEGDCYWNGATQAKSGIKFKYEFPKFHLCWTIFRDLKLRVPCNTEDYIQANYGPNWFIPIRQWDWKSSPYNVKPNGVWPKDKWWQTIKIYH